MLYAFSNRGLVRDLREKSCSVVKKWPLSRVPKGGLPGFGETSAKTKEFEPAFAGLPRNAWLVGKAYVLLLLASLSAHAAQPENLTPGIVGADDRKRVEESGPPWDAIGQINISGYRRMSRCTGTLIAPDMVITAAHCVIDPWKKFLSFERLSISWPASAARRIRVISRANACRSCPATTSRRPRRR